MFKKMLSTQLTKLVHLVLEVVQRKGQSLLDVIIALEEERLELIKDFLLFNKLALNVADTEK